LPRAEPGFLDQFALDGLERRLARLELAGRQLPDPAARGVAILTDQADAAARVDCRCGSATGVVDDLQLGHVAVRQPHGLEVDGDDPATEHIAQFLDAHGHRVMEAHHKQ